MESWLLEKWSHHVCRRVLFLIFLRCRFQGEGQGKKAVFLSVSNIYISSTFGIDEMQIITELFTIRTSSVHRKLALKFELICCHYSRETLDRCLAHKHKETNRLVVSGAQLVPAGIPIVCWTTSPQDRYVVDNSM